MTEDRLDGDRKTALALMGMALALLDRADDKLAAARLQHAIDTTKGWRGGTPPMPGRRQADGAFTSESPTSSRTDSSDSRRA